MDFDLDVYFDVISGSLLNGDRTNKAEVITWAMKCLKEEGKAFEVNHDQIIQLCDAVIFAVGGEIGDCTVCQMHFLIVICNDCIGLNSKR